MFFVDFADNFTFNDANSEILNSVHKKLEKTGFGDQRHHADGKHFFF
jgi:hypothetical protein